MVLHHKVILPAAALLHTPSMSVSALSTLCSVASAVKLHQIKNKFPSSDVTDTKTDQMCL